jgi:hypothetical protein
MRLSEGGCGCYWCFLLLVLGTRFTGLVAGIGFVGAQFAVSMWWWWLVRPQGENERNVSGLWVTFGMVLFALLIVFDLYTYEYAYVTSIAPLPFGTALLNNTIIPLLRGFRGFGYAVILFAALLAALPMIQTQRRIAWRVSGSVRLGLGCWPAIHRCGCWRCLPCQPAVDHWREQSDQPSCWNL